MRLLHPPIDLNAPKGDDEIEYTPLQLSRLRRSAINFQRIVIGALVLFLVASAVLVAAQVIDDRNDAREQCLSANRGRAEIKQAFGGLYDAFVAATGGSDASVKFRAEQTAALNKGLPQRDC